MNFHPFFFSDLFPLHLGYLKHGQELELEDNIYRFLNKLQKGTSVCTTCTKKLSGDKKCYEKKIIFYDCTYNYECQKVCFVGGWQGCKPP